MNRILRVSILGWAGFGSLVLLALAGQAEVAITPIAVPGQPAPGLDNGVVFEGEFRDVLTDGTGQVIFIADVRGPGINSRNRTGLWIGYPGHLQQDGHPAPFNDLGQIVFIGRWDEANGQSRAGIFVAAKVQMLPGSRKGDDMEIAFATAFGRKYRLEYRDAVESGTWAVLKDSVEGTGGRVVLLDPGAANRSKRFYRVALVP